MRGETRRPVGLTFELSDEFKERVTGLRVGGSSQLEPRRVIRHGGTDAAPELVAHPSSKTLSFRRWRRVTGHGQLQIEEHANSLQCPLRDELLGVVGGRYLDGVHRCDG